MKTFMRINSVFTAAFIVLGCQGCKDTSNSAALDTAEEARETAAAGEPEVTPEPEAAAENSADNVAQPDSTDEKQALIAQVRKLTQIQTVGHTDAAGISIAYILEQAATVDDESEPQVVSDAMMFATFYTMPLLYERLPDLDGLQQLFKYKRETIGDIKTTRASYESLNYEEAMKGVTDKESKRLVYRKLLKQLPKGAVQIDRKYRP